MTEEHEGYMTVEEMQPKMQGAFKEIRKAVEMAETGYDNKVLSEKLAEAQLEVKNARERSTSRGEAAQYLENARDLLLEVGEEVPEGSAIGYRRADAIGIIQNLLDAVTP